MSVTDELLSNNDAYATDADEDVRQSIARIQASPFIPKTDAVRGFVSRSRPASCARCAQRPHR